MPDYKINIPIGINSDLDKLHYILNLKEKLRIIHNDNGANMTTSNFNKWVKDYYMPVIELLITERDKLKLKLELDHNYTIDINNAVTVV